MSLRIITKSIWANPGNQGQRLMRTAYALAWQTWKRTMRKTYPLALANGRRFIAHPDCVVSSALIYSQWPEFHELNFVRSELQNNSFVVDVGANVGHIGLLLSDIVRPENILAFEPTPVSFQRLSENWLINQFPTAGLHHAALGDRQGTAWFPDLTNPNTMNAQVAGSENSDQPLIEVPLGTLDSCRNKWTGKKIGFLKIDVEGDEAAVFQGAETTLKLDRPRIIMFESLVNEIDPVVLGALDDADYCIFHLDHNGNPSFDGGTAQNLFATPREIQKEIATG